jgi:2-polyprenyl-3-methyl-5-hydroxy-6-metoxy-1,4-benzoquinol methylase
MDTQLVNQLIELNQKFYAAFAVDFSATRPSQRLNVQPILPYLTDGVKLLDIGCGNGRLAQRLDRENLHLEYVGVDATAALIELAQTARYKHVTALFCVSDVTQRDWTRRVPNAPFDLVVALAVLHHIPSFDLRAQVLRDARALLKPNGKCLMTNWKFDENERLRKKIVPWSTVEIDEQSLEPGDALVAWKRGGTGYRYVHLIAPDEVERLAREAGFKIEKQFYADAGLNLYSVLSVV